MNYDQQPKRDYYPGKRQFHIMGMTSLAIALLLSLTGGNPIPAFAQTSSSIIAGAGDISTCSNSNNSHTAYILSVLKPSLVFTLGDNVYSNGSSSEYKNCYGPTWGAYKSITKPVPGNHEYNTSGASGYFQYFNVPKYYAYNARAWRVYALNSEVDSSSTSAQAQWLKNDLAANPKKCVLAYWHRARWSSGSDHGSDPKTQALWSILYNAKAELVLSGHSHNYERFAPMNSNGGAVSVGLQEIIAGTGGVGHGSFGTILPASRGRNSSTYGVLRLFLAADRYSWKYFPYQNTYTDSGTIYCH